VPGITTIADTVVVAGVYCAAGTAAPQRWLGRGRRERERGREGGREGGSGGRSGVELVEEVMFVFREKVGYRGSWLVKGDFIKGRIRFS